MVRSALDPALASIDLADDRHANANAVLETVRKSLKTDLRGTAREYAFGCTLFAQDVESFSVGAVRLEPRLGWLQRKTADGSLGAIAARRIDKIWLGAKLGKRKLSEDSFAEEEIVDAIGGCRYVCSVTTSGLASSAGRLKAQTAARLVLTGIALCWNTPSSALDGFNLLIDRSVRRQKILTFIPGKGVSSDSTLEGRPNGPPIAAKDWAKILAKRGGEFSVMAEMIEFYLSPDGKVARPQLMNMFAQAFLWFHEGCREHVGLMAIVNFAATLDTLASGGETAGILKLIKARLGQARTP